MSDREELKALIRTEPTVAATFAEVDSEHAAAIAHAASLKRRRDELQGHLDRIEQAKSQLGKDSTFTRSADTKKSTGEPAPATEPADKPSIERTEK